MVIRAKYSYKQHQLCTYSEAYITYAEYVQLYQSYPQMNKPESLYALNKHECKLMHRSNTGMKVHLMSESHILYLPYQVQIALWNSNGKQNSTKWLKFNWSQLLLNTSSYDLSQPNPSRSKTNQRSKSSMTITIAPNIWQSTFFNEIASRASLLKRPKLHAHGVVAPPSAVQILEFRWCGWLEARHDQSMVQVGHQAS